MKWFKKLFILLVASLLSLSTLSPLPTFAQETPQDAGSFYDDVPQARNTLLGAAQYFHIFAEIANVGSHTNGNVAVKELRGQADIGTKGYNKMEYHYIQNFSFLNSGSFPTRTNTKAVFGKNVNINLDNANRPIINGNALDRVTSNEVYQDKGSNEYINFDQEFNKLENSSSAIMTSPIDATFSHSDFPDQNRRVIDISKYEGPIVHIHLNADVLKHNTPLYIKNLKTLNDSDYKFVYISVDTNSSTSYNVLSPVKLEYENGSNREPHEATNFDDGSILWTFGNGTRPFTGNINLNEIWQGTILAPRASVNSGKNIDGSIIVREFTGQGETHRWDPQNKFGGVKLIKTDDNDSSHFLQGAEFSLYNSKNQLIQSGLKTNSDGVLLVTNLDLGDYYFIETKAPEGYELSNEKHHFTIKSDTVLATVSLSVENTKEEVPEKPKGSVELTKSDDKDASKRLMGAVFALYDNNDTLLQDKLTTDEHGKLVIADLEWGSYYLKETQAPVGYELSDKKYEFTIDKDTSISPILIEAKNTKTEEPEQPKGSVELTKSDDKDASKLLMGAVFALYDNNDTLLQDNLTTDENGKLVIADLEWGSYYLKETQAPVGYELSDKKYEFTIDKDTVVSPIIVDAKNTKTEEPEPKGSVNLIKHDSLDESKYLSGAEFALYDSNNIEILKNIKTNVLGRITLDNLKLGDYYLIETKAPAGYELSTKRYDFKIDVSSVVIPLELKVSNTKTEEPEQPKGSVELTKSDENDASKRLKDAVFALYDNNDNLLQDSLTTDENGKLIITDLEFGSYYLKETQAPEGYDLSDYKYVFTIDESTVFTPILVDAKNTKTEEPQPRVGSVILTKSDAGDVTKYLANAGFALYKENGEIISSEYITNNNGKLRIDNLEFGNYFLKEIKAPDGYELSSLKIPFTIDESVVEKVLNISFTNKKIVPEKPKGSVELIKIDAKDPTHFLEDTIFALYDESGTLVSENLHTNEQGKLTISNLDFGNYYFIETAAPQGYELSNNKFNFTVNEKSVTIPTQITVENTKVDIPSNPSGSVKIIKTDKEDTTQFLKDAQFSLYDEQGTLIKSELNTDDKGELIVNNLPYGNYYFVETRAPEGYQLSNLKYQFTISNLNTELNLILNITNEKVEEPVKQLGSIRITKSDKDAQSVRLANTGFSIYLSDGTLVREDLFTNKDGYIDVTGLEFGNYYFIETKAPIGYSINPEKIAFSISEENSSTHQVFNFYDEKIVEEKPTKPLPNTGVQTNHLSLIIGFILVTIPTCGWFIAKRSKQ
ncbi:hypothetical protein H9L01_05670 [Erysipelothrix inopinata]|uniref:LPXTG cell wall anchor domain-containing protein n=1 Tax=Erysipelothrix inopinata TaxID=225084 RepID=A0A7G9RWA6_9FIRM|nr:LPXTG cell wall anchor domain-containing protein [Erysipelothrix inopinata]QNN59881.1 hypothetical protein H9L01_05670 [Erysipelothrix inopinata]